MRRNRSLSLRIALLSAALLGLGALAASPSFAQSLNAPRPKKDFDIRIPLFEQSTLPNGLTVYSYKDDALPLVAISLAVRSGRSIEPPEKAGLSQLAYAMLGERQDDGEELSPADIGGRLVMEVDSDGSQLQLGVMSEHAERAIALLGARVQQPKVDPRALPRLKAQALAAQSAAAGSPRFLAEQQLRRLIFGAQHPYGHIRNGTAESINAITAEDLTTYYECSFFPKNMALVVAGRITPAKVQEWATRHLGSLQAPARVCEQPVEPVTATRRTQVIAIAKPGLPQTLIMLGRALVPTGHKDEIALSIANNRLAGRAHFQLREKKGVSYGVSWSFEQGPYGGHFRLSTSVQADKTEEALSEIMSQMFQVQSDAVSAQWVIGARLSLAWGIMSHYDTLVGSVEHVASLFNLRQPLSRDQVLLQSLKDTGPNQVDEISYRYFDRNMMQIVVVGDPEIIRTQVGSLKLGTLRWARPDGTLADNP